MPAGSESHSAATSLVSATVPVAAGSGAACSGPPGRAVTVCQPAPGSELVRRMILVTHRLSGPVRRPARPGTTITRRARDAQRGPALTAAAR
jgi:hypothetical protein